MFYASKVVIHLEDWDRHLLLKWIHVFASSCIQTKSAPKKKNPLPPQSIPLFDNNPSLFSKRHIALNEWSYHTSNWGEDAFEKVNETD